MIAIDDKLISEDLLSEVFACNISACKGACCVEGVCGAPLLESEKKIIDETFPKIEHLLSKQSIAQIQKEGRYIDLPAHGLVTPTIGDGVCVYGLIDKQGVVQCAFEKAFHEGISTFPKPISCHLFPVRVRRTGLNELLNYEQINSCLPACIKGKEQKIKVYVFLKEALIRAYGEEFYNALDAVHKQYFES